VTWSAGKHIPKWSEETASPGPVCDREDNVAEHAVVASFQSVPEVAGRSGGIVPEGTAPPRTEDEFAVAVAAGNLQNAIDPFTEEFRCPGSANPRCDRCRAGDEVSKPRFTQCGAIVGPEDGNPGGENRPDGGIRTSDRLQASHGVRWTGTDSLPVLGRR